ncbi:MAG: hypothetical protein J5743_03035, partial [Victivallales bacterium]|nr:hypothetical protein [Victivallales bacterium]
LSVTAAEDADGPLAYGARVVYAVRRVVKAYGLEVPGGIVLEYKQLDAYEGSADPQPTLAATLTVMPYEFEIPDTVEVTYEIFRSKSSNYELLYKVATLTREDLEALTDYQYKDVVADDDLEQTFINLESDGADMTIPPCRFVRAWRGSLICGGFLRSEITVTGTAGNTTITTEPQLPLDDIGCYVTINGEPYTYQITNIDDEGNVTIDTELAADHDGEKTIRWRDDDVVYVSRPLAGNIEVYSAETGRVVTNAGADNAMTGIASHGSYAYIFRRDTVEILTGSPASPSLEPFPGNPPGCRGHATIADNLSPYVLYYAGVKGVWRISGSDADRVSGPIDPFIQFKIDHTQDDRCHAVYDPASRMYFLFLFSLDWKDSGIRMPDTLLILDTATGAWSRGELYASRSGLFRGADGETVPVIGLPGTVARLNVGHTDGGVQVVGRIMAYGADWITFDDDINLSGVIPGMPVHVSDSTKEPFPAIRRMVKSVSGQTISIYGEWPDDMDISFMSAVIGGIRWKFKTPEIALSGDFDRNVKLEALAIAHRKAETSLPVRVKVSTIGEISDRAEDSQKWDVIDMATRSLSRIDGKATGLRGASMMMEVEGPWSPVVVKGIRIETTRSSR